MENITVHIGGWFLSLILENTKTGIKKEFSYTNDPLLISEYAKQLL